MTDTASTETAAAADPAVINRLVLWWNTIDPSTQAIFEQIYTADAALLLRVLTSGAMEPPADKPTFASILEGVDQWKAANAIPSALVGEVQVDPGNPESRAAFTVRFTVSAMGGPIPAHTNSIQVLDENGAEVAAKTLSQGALEDGGNEAIEAAFDEGLASGSYQLVVWANLEGTDGTGVSTAQGIRGYGGAMLHVGQTRGGQIAGDMPIFSDAVGALQGVTFAEQPGPRELAQFAAGLRRLKDLDQLGEGFQGELESAASSIESASIDPDNEEQMQEWRTAMQQLVGAVAMATPDTFGDFALTAIQIANDLSGQ